MAWNQPGGNGDRDPWGDRGKQEGPPDLDEALRKLQVWLKRLLGGGVSVPGKVQIPGGKSRKVSTRRRFQLKSVKTGVATITVAYQVLTPINNAQIKAQLLQRLHKGEIRFDVDAGRVISQRLDIDDRAIGFSGPASSTHYLMRFEERLLKPNERVAAKPPRPAGPEPAPKR
jgi:hypothetical protein